MTILADSSLNLFTTLPLPAAMFDNLASLGFTQMTPIQAHSLPSILQNRDLIGKAKTGSGKTAAFGIGLLCKLNVREFRVQVLVLCPTRELADQVGKDIRQLARFQHNIKVLTLCGGVSIGRQIGSLEHGAHIIVGTPGRIQDHMRKGTLDLQHVHTLVLDEADRMLDMGFIDAIKAIIEQVPKQRQTLLFSATFPDAIKTMSASIQHNPVEVSVESTHSEAQIQQVFYEVEPDFRGRALIALLGHYRPASAAIFCNTKVQCQEVVETLQQRGIAAAALHGDMEQKERDQVLVLFSNKSIPILVATDVAARGLDIKDLAAVINFELSRDPEVHIHRIGRTGRAGNEGLALSLYTPAEARRVAAIEAYQKSPINFGQLDKLRTKDAVESTTMVTICIDAGRKDKVRAGDILGALTGVGGIPGSAVGKIDISDFHAYAAIDSEYVNQALQCLANGKIKGRTFKVRKMR
jgi:ATP-dependent RNA helicase DbpA